MMSDIIRKIKINPVVIPLFDIHWGVAFSLKFGAVCIGRDPAVCAVVYPMRLLDSGLDKVHCKVSFDNKTEEFILTDMGSLHGTFLENGEMINEGESVRLKKGSIFYLGSEKNACRVEILNDVED